MIQLSVIWDVSPRIVDLGGIEVRWYGLLFAMAFFASYILLSKLFKKEGIKIEVLDKLTIYILVGTIIGARLGHVLFYQPDYYLKNPLEVLMIWEGGLASHGAAIGILLAVWMFVRKTKRNAWWVLDRLVIAVPMAGAFIRGGNLMNSEIYGGPTSLPWGFQFVRDFPADTPLSMIPASHPTQIYEALGYLLIAAILLVIYFRKNGAPAHGFIFGLFLVLLFFVRFMIEFIKNPQVDFEKTMAINMGQILSLPFIIAGLVIIYFSMRKKQVI